MELLTTLLAFVLALLFTLSVRRIVQLYNVAEVNRKRKELVIRAMSTCRMEDKDGALCGVSMGERNVQCMTIENSRFVRRQKLEIEDENRKSINKLLQRIKQLIISVVSIIRNKIHRSELKFDSIKISINISEVISNKNIEGEINNEKFKFRTKL